MVNRPLTRPAPGWVAPGGRVYVIGDVHGCVERLIALHQLIAADLARDPVERPTLIHLGDYIDRGRQSAAVIRWLVSGTPLSGIDTVNLRGNHEQMLLDALTGAPEMVDQWLANGAAPTLQSWGTDTDYSVVQWRHAIGGPTMAFLQALPLHHRLDGYVFVHAGVRPGIPLPLQADDDLLWIRQGFLDWAGPLLPDDPTTAVVHGHTPVDRPTIASHRLGIDTGAVMGGRLTCAILEQRTVRFMQT